MDDGAQMATKVVLHKRPEFCHHVCRLVHLAGGVILQRPVAIRGHDNDGCSLHVHPSSDGRRAFNLHRALRRTWLERLRFV